MTTEHKDKDGKKLHTGDLVHFTVDGRPYTGIIHALVRRDHEPAVLTLVQLFLPVSEVSKEPPKHQDAGDEKPDAHEEKDRVDPNKEKQHEPKDTTPQGEKNAAEPPSFARHQSEATAHSDQQQHKPADLNRGSTLAEPKKGSR